MVLLCLFLLLFLLFLTSDQANKNRKGLLASSRAQRKRQMEEKCKLSVIPWQAAGRLSMACTAMAMSTGGFLRRGWLLHSVLLSLNRWDKGKDLKEGFFLRKIEQNVSIVKQRAKPSRLFHPLSLILIDITINLCRWTRSQPKIRYTSHIHNRCIFELIHRTDLVTHLCQGSELLRRKVRCCEAFKLESFFGITWHHSRITNLWTSQYMSICQSSSFQSSNHPHFVSPPPHKLTVPSFSSKPRGFVSLASTSKVPSLVTPDEKNSESQTSNHITLQSQIIQLIFLSDSNFNC